LAHPTGLKQLLAKKVESKLPSRWTMENFTLVIRFY